MEKKKSAYDVILDNVFEETRKPKGKGPFNYLLRFDVSCTVTGAGSNPQFSVAQGAPQVPFILPYSKMVLKRVKSSFSWVKGSGTLLCGHYVVFTGANAVVNNLSGVVYNYSGPAIGSVGAADTLTWQIARNGSDPETQETVPYLIDRSGFYYTVVPFVGQPNALTPQNLAYAIGDVFSHRMDMEFDVIDL